MEDDIPSPQRQRQQPLPQCQYPSDRTDEAKSRQKTTIAGEASASSYRILLVAEIINARRHRIVRTRRQLREILLSLPPGRVTYDDNADRWMIRGMTESLFHHQAAGCAWMVGREKASSISSGGILADAMGLGKTVQALATIVAHPRPTYSDGTYATATLIVCPRNLIDQWRAAIERFVDTSAVDFTGALVHARGSRADGLNIEEQLGGASIVITSYEEVRRSFPEPPCHLASEAEIATSFKRYGRREAGGPLHRVRWHRVVLDECTAIKNYRTGAAQACIALEAQHRWLLSGTPLVDRTGEMYSYLLFLRSRVGSCEQFDANYQRSEAAQLRLQQLLSAVTLRRTYRDRVLEQGIATVPPCRVVTLRVSLDTLERLVYDICRQKFIHRLDCEAVDLKRSPPSARPAIVRHILTLLLRLRQIAVHPLVAARALKLLLGPAERRKIKRVGVTTGAGSGDGSTQPFERLRKIQQSLWQADGGGGDGGTAMAHHTQQQQVGNSFGTSTLTGKVLLALIDEYGGGRACTICSADPAVNMLTTSCHHVYCTPCLEAMFQNSLTGNTPAVRCAVCDGFITSYTSEDEEKRQERGRGRELTNTTHGWIWAETQATLPPSTKLIAVKAQLLRWFAAEPGVKVVVYTAFKPVIWCLLRLCHDEGWPALPYYGDQSFEERAQTVNRFSQDASIRVLVASLKAGSLGLDLTCATKIVSLDLWWNRAVEDQAFHRIYRIGQSRPTEILRITADGTVDQNILGLQRHKEGLIEAILSSEPAACGTLATDDLLALFHDGGDGGATVADPFVLPSANHRSLYFGGSRGFPVRRAIRVDESEQGDQSKDDDGREIATVTIRNIDTADQDTDSSDEDVIMADGESDQTAEL